MAILVVAEHDDRSIHPATLHAVTAARQCGGDVHLLVAGALAGDAAKAASRIAGVCTVVRADGARFRPGFSEDAVADQVAFMAEDYAHIVFAATPSGNRIASRVAAKLASEPVTDVTRVVKREISQPEIHVGDAIVSARPSARGKVFTVRTAAFEPAASSGGMASFRCLEAAS